MNERGKGARAKVNTQAAAGTKKLKSVSTPNPSTFPPIDFPTLDIDLKTIKEILKKLGKNDKFERLPKTSNFDKLISQYRSAYGSNITVDSLTVEVGKLSEKSLPVAFVEQTLPADFFSKATAEANRLNPRYCDRLLAQGKTHLDAAIAIRDKFIAMRQRAFEEKTAIEEYLELRKIHDDEVDKRFYELRYDKASVMAESSAKIADVTQRTVDVWNVAQSQNFYKRVLEYKQAIAKAAELSASPLTLVEDGPTKKTYEISAGGIFASGPKPAMLARNADIIGYIQADQYNRYFLSQRDASVSNAIRVAAETRVQELEKAWAEQDRGFRRRRTNAARAQMDMRIFEMTRPNGSLNFQRLAAELEASFKKRITLALPPLVAAKAGLRTFYGINNDSLFPTFTGDWIVRLTDWIAACQDTLERFRHRDQMGVKVLASTSRVGSTFNMVLRPNDVLKGRGKYVRLLGVSATAIGEAQGVWECTVTPPGGLAPFFLGRVRVARDHVEPDVVGTNVLYNGSPFGAWKVDVSTAGLSSQLEWLQGIELHLHLAYQQ